MAFVCYTVPQSFTICTEETFPNLFRGSTGGGEAGRSLSGNESNLSLLDRYWALKGGAGYEGDSLCL